MCLSLAVRTDDGRIFVESIDCRNQRDGNEWILNFIMKCNFQTILVDGASGVETFLKECKEQKLKGVSKVGYREIIQASSDFETAIANKVICHNGQPALRQSATNCKHRAIGSGGGYGYSTLDDEIEVALVESVILATYACSNAKEAKKQRVSY